MTDLGWIDNALTGARPKAVAALLRYFRDLDTAEEAFQEACLRALKTWPTNGPPRDPAAWLILVGRNIAFDSARRKSREQELPDEDEISDLGDAEAEMADRLDDAHYRDDILRLLFVCCDPVLPSNQQIALALRIVSGLSVKEIARAFLAGESAMEQRITRAKRRVGERERSVRGAGRGGAIRAARRRRDHDLPAFQRGLFGERGQRRTCARRLCDEAIRLSRLLLKLFPSEPEIMGLTALLLLQHARTPARLDADGAIVLLEDQDRSLWNKAHDRRGRGADREGHAPPASRRLSDPGGDRRAACRGREAEDTDWAQIDLLYESLERMQPSPVVSLNRAVA